jgi:hypothetical protein
VIVIGACWNGPADSPVTTATEGEMQHATQKRKAFQASEAERASIRALKNWLLAAPGESPFDDQIVRLRIAAAIATLSSAALENRPAKN